MHDHLTRVVDCIAQTTRYPRQLLVPDADLENDLGIDSVKRVEIVAAIADEFELDISHEERDDSIRTIGHVAHWVETRVAARNGSDRDDEQSSAPVQPAPVQPTPEPPRQTYSQPPASTPVPRFATDKQPFMSAPGLISPPPAAPTNGSNGSAPHDRRVSAPHLVPPPKQLQTYPQNGNGSSAGRPLHGRVALVTGSGRGVGRTIARLLASRGATVIVNSFHSHHLGEQTAAEINASGGNAVHLWGSVANPEQINALFDHVEQQLGYLDILVCNASDGRLGAFTDVNATDWDRAFSTNVSGHHHCAMRASRLMQPRGGGSIVTMSSVASQRYVQGMGCQGVVKAAVESMTRYLACELVEYGIRTNCVCGGPVYGDVMQQYEDARRTFNYWETIIPDGEMCSPMDLATTIAFLVSDEARAINGAIWTVDHGASTRAHSRPLPQPSMSIPTAAPR